eukprot:6300761-Amphidinium_carterae.1
MAEAIGHGAHTEPGTAEICYLAAEVLAMQGKGWDRLRVRRSNETRIVRGTALNSLTGNQFCISNPAVVSAQLA